ncbi:hypothetical protein [Pontibacter litorisediminis]|uniref:hypothetical protein n=1 Tax=Pontibacter litorisediminis TaxID=1846260 RepID=UPI0023EC3614|nr:hypothetical protein [Pontibacter litorisediminis]
MKKVILLGSLCLAMGMASCKTYCPAYNYASVETPAQEKAAVTASAEELATEQASI